MLSAGSRLMSNLEVWKIWEGRVVDGKFRLRQLLGGSDHSAVFLIERPSSEKAAIKLIPADEEQAVRQLTRWSAAERLSHPHLLRICESGHCEINGTPHVYVVMESADEDLSQVLPQRPLRPAEADDLLPPVLDALSYLHARKLVHSRIKPSNILAVGDQLKLSADQLLPAGEPNPARERRDLYDAPETGAGVISPEADIWSLGVTLFTTLTQNVPFSDELSQRDPEALKKIPEPYRGIVRECLHLDPKRRCSIAQIQARLQPAARAVPAEPEQAPVQPPRRRPLPIATMAVVLGLIIWLVITYTRGKSTPPAAPTDQASQKGPSQTSQPAPTPAAPAAQPTQPTSGAATGGVVRTVVPDVPKSARNTVTGKIKVNVQVDVDPAGKVTEAKLTRSGPSHYFANLALKAAREWEFSPAESNGRATASTWVLHFRFSRAGADVSPERLKR
jgi:TonB family protein